MKNPLSSFPIRKNDVCIMKLDEGNLLFLDIIKKVFIFCWWCALHPASEINYDAFDGMKKCFMKWDEKPQSATTKAGNSHPCFVEIISWESFRSRFRLLFPPHTPFSLNIIHNFLSSSTSTALLSYNKHVACGILSNLNALPKDFKWCFIVKY